MMNDRLFFENYAPKPLYTKFQQYQFFFSNPADTLTLSFQRSFVARVFYLPGLNDVALCDTLPIRFGSLYPNWPYSRLYNVTTHFSDQAAVSS